MTTQRPERVQEALRREIGKIVQNEMKDPRIGIMTSITKVVITRDLRFARVYFSVLGGEKERDEARRGLESAKGFIKILVGKRVLLKFTPDLVFKYDESSDRRDHIDNVLEELAKEKNDEGTDARSAQEDPRT
ncbi:MAG: 30S ribosome-binding factor RbfA [Candidatus Omnitrophota bacterium]